MLWIIKGVLYSGINSQLSAITYSELAWSSMYSLGCWWVDKNFEPSIHTFFAKWLLYVWILVNFHQNICKGLNFDKILKHKAFNLVKQTPTRILSWCSEVFRAAYWASPNGWFSCKRKNSNKGTLMEISGF